MIVSPRADTAQMRFELGVCLLNGVQIGTVWRQEQEPAFLPFERLGRPRAAVRGEIVEDHDRAWLKSGGKLRGDIGVERNTIHGTFDYPWGYDAVAGQARDECLGLPSAEGGGTVEPLPDWRPAPQPGQIGLYGRLVNEHQAVWLGTHARLAARDPLVAGRTHIRALTLAGDQAFFYMSTRPAPVPGGSRRHSPAHLRRLPVHRQARPT